MLLIFKNVPEYVVWALPAGRRSSFFIPNTNAEVIDDITPCLKYFDTFPNGLIVITDNPG